MEICEVDAVVLGQPHGLLGPGLQLLDPIIRLGAICTPRAALIPAAALPVSIACLLPRQTISDAPATVVLPHGCLNTHKPDGSPPLSIYMRPQIVTARRRLWLTLQSLGLLLHEIPEPLAAVCAAKHDLISIP